MTARAEVARILRLHGEDGEVYILSDSGEKLWRLGLVSLDVSEHMNSITKFEIQCIGLKIEPDA